MSRFRTAETYHPSQDQLELLPLRFERVDADRYLVSNIVGDFIWLSDTELNRLVDLNVSAGDGLYEKAFVTHLLSHKGKQAQTQLLATRLRS